MLLLQIKSGRNSEQRFSMRSSSNLGVGRNFPTPEGSPPKQCRMQGRVDRQLDPLTFAAKPVSRSVIGVSFSGEPLCGPVPTMPQPACQPPSLTSDFPLKLIVTGAYTPPSSTAVPHSCHLELIGEHFGAHGILDLLSQSCGCSSTLHS